MFKKNLLALACLAMAAPAFSQSPWAKNKGEGYAQVGYNFILPTSSIFVDNTSFKRVNRTIYDNNFQAYAEYGLIEKLTIYGDINAKYVATGQVATIDPNTPAEELPPALVLPQGKKFGLGNSSLGAKYNFYNKGLLVTGCLTAMLPTTAADTLTALATGYNSFGLAPSLAVGGGGAKWYGYLNAGANFRTGAFSHELIATLEAGRKLGKMYLIFNSHIRYNLGNQPNPEIVHTALSVNGQNYLALGLKAHIPIKDNLGLNLSAFGALLGNNVQAAPSFGASVFYKWD